MENKNPLPKYVKNRKGQTLIEYMLTMIIVFFAFYGFYAMMSQTVPEIFANGASYIVPPYEGQ